MGRARRSDEGAQAGTRFAWARRVVAGLLTALLAACTPPTAVAPQGSQPGETAGALPPPPPPPPPPTQAPVPTPGAPVPITMHSWRPLALAPEAPWQGPTSALYTYVLAGDIGGPSEVAPDAGTAQARSALQALLHEVEQAEFKSPTGAPFPEDIRVRMNQFCIPVKPASRAASVVALADYDFGLSSDYRHRFQVILDGNAELRRALMRRGPFLVATRLPTNGLIGAGAQRVQVDSPILVMDLTGFAAQTVPYFVEAFKQAVATTQPGTTRQLRPLKPTIVSYLTSINKGLPLVAEVWSKTLKTFEGKA